MSQGGDSAVVSSPQTIGIVEDALQKRLERACARGDLTSLEEILATSPGRRALLLKNSTGSTALHACLGPACMEETLLYALQYEEGREAAAMPNNFGATVLHRSCAVGSVPLVKELLKIPPVRALLTSDLHSQGTPLHFACRKNNVAVVELLLQIVEGRKALEMHCGKDTGSTLSTPLFIAAALKHGAQLVRLILSSLESTEVRRRLMCPEPLCTSVLHLAARNANVGVVRELLRHMEGRGLALLTDSTGSTPLFLACKNSAADVITALLEVEEGRDSIQVVCNRDTTVLDVACISMEDASALALLAEPSAASLINRLSGIRGGPMHRACSRGFHRVVARMLEFEEGLQAALMKDTTDWVPLHIAASAGCDKCVDHLLNVPEGRDTLSMATKMGESVLDLACQYGSRETVGRILMEPQGIAQVSRTHPFSKGTALHKTCSPLSLGALELLLETPEGREAAYNQDLNGFTALHLAASEGLVEHAKLLLQACDAEDFAQLLTTKGETALHIALKREEKAVAVAIILVTGPKTWMMRDEYGQSAEDVARASGMADVADMLGPRAKGAF